MANKVIGNEGTERHVPRTHHMRHYGDLGMASIDWSLEKLADYDCVLVATDHKWYDWRQIADHAKLVVDTRGAMRAVNTRVYDVVSA